MNLLEYYKEHSSENIHLKGSAGSGKSSSIIYLFRELLRALKDGEQIGGKYVVPIYIRMSHFNLIKKEYNPILTHIANEYFEGQNVETIKKMFKDSLDYRYLILLDGVNELIDGDDDIPNKYLLFENEIKDLMKISNVNFIASTRMGENTDLFCGNIDAFFKEVNMKKLDVQQVSKYLGNNEYDTTVFEEILVVPMLLHMFRVVYRRDAERARKLRNKYQLMDFFFSFDTKNAIDPLYEIEKYVKNEVLPFVAYQYEEEFLKHNRLLEEGFEDVVEKALSRNGKRFKREQISEILKKMGYNDIYSMHDLVREFLALKEWENRINLGDASCVDFINSLINQIKYEDEKELGRRTRHLDLAELFIGHYGKELADVLQPICKDEKEILLTQNLYQELAGVYEDLGREYYERSAYYGWVAAELMEKLNRLDEYEIAKKKNFLFYCCLKGSRKKNADPKKLLDEAGELIEKCDETPTADKNKVCSLRGKIYSNIGAYYYQKKWGNDYNIALKYHMQALKYREDYSKKDVSESLRTIMSDYYQLKQYEKAYEIFKRIIEEKVKERDKDKKFFSDLDPAFDWPKMNDLETVIIRGIGNEIELIEDPLYRDEILRELKSQIGFVYSAYSSGCRRNDRNSLSDLKKKLDIILEKNIPDDIKEMINAYLDKCEERLGIFG